jgi:peroxin-19
MYPAWLAEHVEHLSTVEYENYGKQFQLFQKLVAVYETEPDNFPALMEMMHDLQETGQPPKEIVKKLAPGLDLGADGLPTIPSMGEGVPSMPGMPAGACTVM